MLMLAWFIAFTVALSVCASIMNHAYCRMKRPLLMVDGLNALMSNHTAIISISKIDETSLSVAVIADWTGYAEQCFFSDTLEGAIAMAIEHKAKSESRS